MCERWDGDWTKTATYWPPIPPSLAALLSRSAGLLNPGTLRAKPSAGSGSHCLELQQTDSNSKLTWYLRPDAPVIYTSTFLIWQLGRVRGQYVTPVSHEFCNPLLHWCIKRSVPSMNLSHVPMDFLGCHTSLLQIIYNDTGLYFDHF